MAKYWPTGLSEEEIFIAPSASRPVSLRYILDVAALHNRHLESIECGKGTRIMIVSLGAPVSSEQE